MAAANVQFRNIGTAVSEYSAEVSEYSAEVWEYSAEVWEYSFEFGYGTHGCVGKAVAPPSLDAILCKLVLFRLIIITTIYI